MAHADVVQTFVYLRPGRDQQPRFDSHAVTSGITECLADAQVAGGVQLGDVFTVAGSEWTHIIETFTDNLSTLTDFLLGLTSRGFETSTKCVLHRWKDGRFDENKGPTIDRSRDLRIAVLARGRSDFRVLEFDRKLKQLAHIADVTVNEVREQVATSRAR